MVKILISFLFVLLAGTAWAADEWTREDYTLEVLFATVHTMDWLQTRQIAKQPETYHETNTLLGRHPSTREVDRYFAATLAGHVLGTHLLPQEYRKYWQLLSIGIVTGTVINNYQVGLMIEY